MASQDAQQILTAFENFAERDCRLFFIFEPAGHQFSYFQPSSYEQIWQRDARLMLDDPETVLASIHPEDLPDLQKSFGRMLQGEGNSKEETEFRIALPDGSERWIQLRVQRQIQEHNGDTIIGLAEDITRKRAYRDSLLRFNAKKNSVLEILSHDLAGPMNTLKGLTNAVARRTEQYHDESLNKITAMMLSTCTRGVDLIRSFVAQEFLESSGIELVRQRVNLVERVREAIGQYKTEEEAVQKTFRLETNAETIYVEIDTMKFMQVINNLISNAIKFTHDDGVITTRLEERESTILITIQDNGIGIPEHLQAGLFEKFTKARRPGLKGEPSTGLGMSIIRTIVEWHGGTIWFESTENVGTSFYIEIPKH